MAPCLAASYTSLALEVENFTMEVGGRRLVDGVSFDVRPGEIVAVIGPNGAGKTTLLEGVVGLRRAKASVRVSGRELRSFAERGAAFAFAPDDALPPPEALVSTLIDHADRHRPRDSAVRKSLQNDLQLVPLLSRSAGVLSHGERKRLSLYLALAADRAVVVLDEPFGAFDPLRLRGVLEVVRSVARLGVAVLVSIHQLLDAERIADRVLILSEGRRIAFGSVESIRAQAASAGSLEEAFVALLSSEGGRDAT